MHTFLHTAVAVEDASEDLVEGQPCALGAELLEPFVTQGAAERGHHPVVLGHVAGVAPVCFSAGTSSMKLS